jgi:hypothetical protein
MLGRVQCSHAHAAALDRLRKTMPLDFTNHGFATSLLFPVSCNEAKQAEARK